MTMLHALLNQILVRGETAAVGAAEDRIIPVNAQLEYLQLALARADALLDRRRDQVWMTVLNIPDKTTAHRVAAAYDVEYLLSLGLSLDATVDLAKELVATMRRMGVRYPNSWDALAMGAMDLEEPEPYEVPVIREKVIQ